MGEVYKARDTRLDRIVAVKVLPSHFTENAEARQRFDREAKAISSLNHPNICTLFDVGHQDGIDFLVMEYLEGETLASRLTKGPLPLTELLVVAMQIADSLDKAHRQNLVHRDLKPGNIMLAKSGAKLLDFGLAKLRQESLVIPGESDVTRSTPLTGQGAIVGTLQYMSPEQLEGKEVDQRSDIFAFGAILYEMISGRRAFESSSQASLIASILKGQPRSLREMEARPPRSLERTVEQCLAKDPDDRWQSAGDLKRELAWIFKEQQDNGEYHAGVPVPVSQTSRSAIFWAVALTAISVIAVALVFNFKKPAQSNQEIQRFVIPTDSLESDFSTPATVSPDGKLIAYTDAGKLRLRELSQFDADIVCESRNLGGIFWSPDSRTIAFGQDQRLWRYDVVTREKRLMCSIPETGRILGGCWNEVGDIYMAIWRGGLYRTSENGGTPNLVIPSDSVLVHDFHTPQFLPDGKTVLLYLHAKRTADNGIVVLQDGRKELTMIQKVPLANGVAYSTSGHLLYTLTSNEGEIWTLPFSFADLRVTGEPVMAIHGGQFPTVSKNGTLVYFGKGQIEEYRLVILLRDSEKVDTIGMPASGMSTPVFSPDGKTILYTAADDGTWNLWKHDLFRGTSERLFSDINIAIRPSWFPTGDRFIFTRILGVSQGTIEAYDIPAGRVTDSICEGMFGTLSPDGQYVVFSTDVQGNFDLWYRDLRKKSLPEPLLRTPAREEDAAVSRDGKWFAYGSNASGSSQIYLRTFPEARSPIQVSVDGGWYPFWHPNGDTLYWVTDSSVVQVSVDWGQTPRLGIPTVVFNSTKLGLKLNSRYSAAGENVVAISPDGNRFAAVMRVGAEGAKSHLMLVMNWSIELEEK